MEHNWRKEADGKTVDEFAMAVEDETTGHNGPVCTVCEFFFCVHCNQVDINLGRPDKWQSTCPDDDC